MKDFFRRLDTTAQVLRRGLYTTGANLPFGPGVGTAAPRSLGPVWETAPDGAWTLGYLMRDEELHAYDGDPRVAAAWDAVLAKIAELQSGGILKRRALPKNPEELARVSLNDLQRERREALSLLDPLLAWARVRDETAEREERRRLDAESPVDRDERLERERRERDERERQQRRAAWPSADDFGDYAEVAYIQNMLHR